MFSYLASIFVVIGSSGLDVIVYSFVLQISKNHESLKDCCGDICNIDDQEKWQSMNRKLRQVVTWQPLRSCPAWGRVAGGNAVLWGVLWYWVSVWPSVVYWGMSCLGMGRVRSDHCQLITPTTHTQMCVSQIQLLLPEY